MISCSRCYRTEMQFDLASGEHIVAKLSPDATGIICSRCTQAILSKQEEPVEQSQTKTKRLHLGRAINEGVRRIGAGTKRLGSERITSNQAR